MNGMNEWMIEWMNDWMNEWLNEWMIDWMNEYNEWMKWMNGKKALFEHKR